MYSGFATSNMGSLFNDYLIERNRSLDEAWIQDFLATERVAWNRDNVASWSRWNVARPTFDGTHGTPGVYAVWSSSSFEGDRCLYVGMSDDIPRRLFEHLGGSGNPRLAESVPGFGSPSLGSPGLGSSRLGSPGFGSRGLGAPGFGSPRYFAAKTTDSYADAKRLESALIQRLQPEYNNAGK